MESHGTVVVYMMRWSFRLTPNLRRNPMMTLLCLFFEKKVCLCLRKNGTRILISPPHYSYTDISRYVVGPWTPNPG